MWVESTSKGKYGIYLASVPRGCFGMREQQLISDQRNIKKRGHLDSGIETLVHDLFQFHPRDTPHCLGLCVCFSPYSGPVPIRGPTIFSAIL
jgi:hypothetical protein